MATDIKVVHTDPLTGKVRIFLSSQLVSGFEWLIQKVILNLLNEQGKAVLDPADGGGLISLIGMNMNIDDPSELYSEIQQRLNKVTFELSRQQIGLELSPDEKIRDIEIIDLRQGTNIDEILLSIRVINEAGRITDLVV